MLKSCQQKAEPVAIDMVIARACRLKHNDHIPLMLWACNWCIKSQGKKHIWIACPMKERTFCFFTKFTSMLGTMTKVYYVSEKETVEGKYMEKWREQSALIITTVQILLARADKYMKDNTKTSRICEMEKQRNPVFRKKSGRILSHWFGRRLRNRSLCCLLRLQMWWTLSPGAVLPQRVVLWGCVCVWNTLMATARAAGTCRLLTGPCPEV